MPKRWTPCYANGLDHVADAFKPRYNKTVGAGGRLGRSAIVWLMRSLFSKLPSSCWTSLALWIPRERCHEPIEDEIQRSTMIIITHDPAVMKMVDTVLEMEGGRHL
jgi:hypothetical protein